MIPAILIGLLVLMTGCGRDHDATGVGVHGDVIKVFAASTDTRLSIIWTLTGQCVQRRGYVHSVPAPPTVVLVSGQVDCGGEQSVGCTEDTTTVWFTVDGGVFDKGTGIIAHEFIHVMLHGAGIFGENHPAFSCVPVVEKETERYYHVFSAPGP